MASENPSDPINMAGSTLLLPLCHATGLRIDEVNYLASKTFALFFAFIFRKYCNVSKVSANTRYLITTLLGFAMIKFCFGMNDLVSLLFFSMVVYSIIRFIPGQLGFYLSFLISFGTLSVFHLHILWNRNIDDYTLDVTATLMIMVQKLTSISASVADGQLSEKEREKLEPSRRKKAIVFGKNTNGSLPLIPFLSYIFNFMGVMAGPHNYYDDYVHWIENDGDQNDKKNALAWQNSHAKYYSTVAFKAVWGSICLGLSLYVNSTWCNVNLLGKPEYVNNSSFGKLLFHMMAAGAFASRFKFYFAWMYSEAINNAAGYGWNREKNDWSLISNVDWFKVELARDSKEAIGNWNTQSVMWLRIIAHEQLPKKTPMIFKTASVFILSSIWHGFYPGYYFFFTYGILMTVAGKRISQFQKRWEQANSGPNGSKVNIYGFRILRAICFHICFNYVSVAHLLLTFERCSVFYYRMGYFGHFSLVLLTVSPLEKMFGLKNEPRVEKRGVEKAAKVVEKKKFK